MQTTLPPDDQQLLARVTSELVSVRSLPPDEQGERTRQVLSKYSITQGGSPQWASASMNLTGELTAVSFRRPDLDYEPDGWDRVGVNITNILTQLSGRVSALQMRIAFSLRGAER
jgi:hypothetical protein